MDAGIITIGNEILIGQIIDTNSAWLASELNKIGIHVEKIESISDDVNIIKAAMESALSRFDVIVLSGGLGPTSDDKTKFALAEFFNTRLVRHSDTYKKIVNRLSGMNIPITKLNEQQADLPESCTVLPNLVGSVPGLLFQKDGKFIVSVPGVPYEMKHIITNEFIPFIENKCHLPNIYHKTYQTVGEAESILSERLKDVEHSLPTGFSLAYLPSPGKVRLRLSARDISNDDKKVFDRIDDNLKTLLGNSLFGYEDETLELVVGDLLKKNKLSVSTAESCTGGKLAGILTSVPGASEYFVGGIVCYANEVKSNTLNVLSGDIEEYGAVSEQVVLQMAENVRKKLSSDYGIATSGIAGPTGGTDDKPVGTVWIAVASPDSSYAKQFNFGKDRGRTITRTSLMALNMLRMEIIENNRNKK